MIANATSISKRRYRIIRITVRRMVDEPAVVAEDIREMLESVRQEMRAL